MKLRNHLLFLFFCLFLPKISFSQALPANRYFGKTRLLDQTNVTPSFAYSLRKLKFSYNGFAVKVRRSTDNAEANVAFNDQEIVSNDSQVTVTAVGTSALTVGQTLSYTTFSASNTILVTTWYDQGSKAYHAVQTNQTRQPPLTLNIAGAFNNLPAIQFDGNKSFVVFQPIENLVLNSINGTFNLVIKPTANQNQLSFGYIGTSDWRWAFHINWSDGYCYFDAAESCCDYNTRRFYNAGNINAYKLYTFIRTTTSKTVNLNSVVTTTNNSLGPSVSQTGGMFGIGNYNNWTSSTGFLGNACEIVLFPIDFTAAQIKPLELNQMSFWQL
jgi:hypothetical protein